MRQDSRSFDFKRLTTDAVIINAKNILIGDRFSMSKWSKGDPTYEKQLDSLKHSFKLYMDWFELMQ